MLDIRNSFSLCITHCDVGLTSGVGGKWKMNVFDRGDMLGKAVVKCGWMFQSSLYIGNLIAM